MSKVDMVIRGGTIFDGTGAPPFSADIAVDNGRIAEIGAIRAQGKEEIDAKNLIIAPGWVDIHTHYDGQITWSPQVTPSSSLGTTTVVTGNCGVGFAPVRAQDHAALIKLMEGVEDIPGSALNEGLSWGWETFPDYMNAVDRLPHDVDIGVQLPHGALRLYVMGERGANREPATPRDAAAMRTLTRQAIEAGALGFSTTRTMVHRTADGNFTPTFGAARAELEAIALGLADAGRGVLQWVSDFANIDEEFSLLKDLTRISGRPLSFSLVQHDIAPGQWKDLMKRLDTAVSEGFPIKAQVAGRPVGLMLGLQGSIHPFMNRASYKSIAGLPLPEKVSAMRNPELRARLIAEPPEEGHPLVNALGRAYSRMFELGDPPNYEPDMRDSFGARAKTLGIAVDDLIYNALVANEGRNFIYFPLHNFVEGNLDNVHEMLANPNTLSGLSDGGAHVGAICDVSLPTYMLTHWCRDRLRGRKFDLPEVIRWQTRDTAAALGLSDRGVLSRGNIADINVIDFDRLKLRPPAMVYDLPAGAPRLMQEADGYVATIKTGKVIYRNGQATGILPGRLFRGGPSAE